MFKDPIFQALDDYKGQHPSDVIRHEYAIIAEIARCHQYRKAAKNPIVSEATISALEEVLAKIRALRGSYLTMQFDNYLKSIPWWQRRSVRADPAGWKYLYYQTARKAAVNEILALFDSIENTAPKVLN
jgi:hypothetical protein